MQTPCGEKTASRMSHSRPECVDTFELGALLGERSWVTLRIYLAVGFRAAANKGGRPCVPLKVAFLGLASAQAPEGLSDRVGGDRSRPAS